MDSTKNLAVEKTSALLQDVFGSNAPSSEEYLNWLYNENPAGLAQERNFDEENERLGHYVVVPLPLSYNGRNHKIGLSLNTAVSPKAQGKGVFSKLAKGVLEDVSASGYSAVMGLANANSTPGFVRRLEFKLLTPLPVRISSRPIFRARDVMEGDKALHKIAKMNEKTKLANPSQPNFNWSYDQLKWRLNNPLTQYISVADKDIGLIAKRITKNGVQFTVIMALFGKAPAQDVGRLIASACAKLGTFFYIYAGWNQDCQTTGIQLPERFKPSPLNLIWRTFDVSQSIPDPLSFRRFEFLEFDAY